jgi:hypothetical protein
MLWVRAGVPWLSAAPVLQCFGVLSPYQLYRQVQ